MKMNQKQKDTILSGMSTLGGAAVGTIGGTFVAQEVNAAEVVATEAPSKTEPEDVHATVEEQPQNQAAQDVEPDPEPTPEPKPSPKPTPEPEPEPEPSPNPDTEIEVVGYETVTNEDGSQSDIAILSVNGQGAAIIDVDQDGFADVMAADQNLNGQIEDNEVVNIQGQGIAMEPFKTEFESNQLALNDDGPDYINDGGVDSYIS